MNLNRILIILFFLTTGTLGALLGVLRSETSKTRSSQKAHALSEDQLRTSSAGVLKSGSREIEMRGQTGAVIRIGVGPSGTPESEVSAAQWDQLLKTAPLTLLQKAFFNRLQELEKESVDSRFHRPSTPEDEKTQSEILFHAFEAQASGESYWVAQTRIQISGKERPVSMLLHFYDALHVSGPLTASTPQTGHDPHEVCWYLETNFAEANKVEPQVKTGCFPLIARAGEKYFITQFINNESVQPFYTHLAVEIPLKAETSASFELLDTQALKWKPQSSLAWTLIESEEAERYQKEFHTLH